MRTLVIYLLALMALGTAAYLGFPELFASSDGKPALGASKTAAPPPVIVTEVVRAPFVDTLEALGTVRANESVEITSNRADHVAAILFTDGQEVEEGQLLVEMNAQEEKALLAEAVAIRDERRKNWERAVELYKTEMSARRELENAQALKAAAEARVISLEAAIADRQVRAPFTGTLGLRRISVGAWVQPSTVITTLDDLSVVKLDFTVPETWLRHVQQGMSITTRSDAWPGEGFGGKVLMVDTRLDAKTRSARVRARLPNPDRKLRPGMLLKVTVLRGEAPALQVPEESIIPIGERHFVLRVGENDIAERAPVAIGRRRPGVVEILEGLAPGDRVVVEGIVRVRPGTAVRVAGTREPREAVR